MTLKGKILLNVDKNIWQTLPLLYLLLVISGCGGGGGSDSGPTDQTQANTQVNPNQEKNIPGWFYSSELNSDRHIYLHLPDDYDASKTYVHLYLLDANWYFDGSHERIGGGGIVEVVTDLVDSDLIPEMIIVGIGNNGGNGESVRGDDFHSQTTPQFLSFINEELIPEVDAQFNSSISNNARILIGHSSAGYFSTYALFKNDTSGENLIENFISLSLWNGHGYADLFLEEDSFYDRVDWNTNLNLRFFMGVGTDEEERFITDYNELSATIQSREYFGLSFEAMSYQDHGHSSYISLGVADGLVFLFGE